MKRFYIFIIMALCAVMSVWADGGTMSVSAPSTVEAGDKFRVQFTVNSNSASKFQMPDFNGFEVLYGPSTSTQSSVQIINGQVSQNSSTTYTIVLLANEAGTFTISPASVQVGGSTIKSRSVTIKVLPAGQGGGASSGSSARQGGSSARQQRQSASQPSGVSSHDLFMTATASRTTVYEQEAILLTYKLYSLVDLTQLDGKLPTLDGFQIQEVPLPQNKEWSLEQYNGRNYRSITWLQYVLFPQKSGQLVIPAVTFNGVVVQRTRNMDPLDAFFNGPGALVEVKKAIVSPKLTINVKELPAKPAGFSGAVGSFTMKSSISSTDVMSDDAVTIKVDVQGKGNMKLIATPTIEWPKNFEAYDPKVTDNFKLTTSGLAGNKNFEYLVVPRNAGQYTIPAIKFIYFDTDSKSYKTLTSEEYVLNVKKGKGGSSSAAVSYGQDQKDVKELAQDIRYIKMGDVSLRQRGESYFGSMSYFLSYIIPLLMFIVAIIAGRKALKANADIARVRGKKANKNAVKRLKTAEKLMREHKQTEFYDEVMRALWGYIADKFNMQQGVLNKDNVQSELASKQCPQELTDGFVKVLSDCEFARYAPGDANENMEAIYNAAIDTISKIENAI